MFNKQLRSSGRSKLTYNNITTRATQNRREIAQIK